MYFKRVKAERVVSIISNLVVIPLNVLSIFFIAFKESILGNVFFSTIFLVSSVTLVLILSVTYIIMIVKKLKVGMIYYLLFLDQIFLMLLYVGEIFMGGKYLKYVYLFVIAIFELYLIYSILKRSISKEPNIALVLIYSAIFVSIGFLTIYFYAYPRNDKSLFNALISIFSALIGGALTLGGVAWTIHMGKEKEGKKEILKYRPYLRIYRKPCEDRYVIGQFLDTNFKIEEIKKSSIRQISSFAIANTKNADIIISEIRVNGITKDMNYFLEAGASVKIVGSYSFPAIQILSDKKDIEIEIIGKDMLNNYYLYKCILKNDILYDIALPELLGNYKTTSQF